ncbi:uncharacterized protein CCOS01_07628 [Colletotrichum costaricense]|uniref:Uncharacterized protein n=2 Tax=Colletotrichum acutatum species complex TaxID=2707335 RepID=A0AAI9YXA5_9PEZI|nr:uncharacterized protein CCOS01_07628 [Colletotrichum costaricense]XP_060384813.1 uncharacterized protein CTAM01_04829 [Colletotrichum tamarilloi]KAK1503517.1 hypothetical protein CTAM01_04829 [Colletotrichum tamarilloi]KAK1527366.1 hypothetical protein CCOS01_07628 [Colletotrichum costaricense]
MAQTETLSLLQDVVVKTQQQAVLESDIQELHDHILAQPGGEEKLRLLAESVSSPVTAMATNDAGAFKSKMGATGSLINLWFYQRVTVKVNVNGKDRQFTANLGGFSPGFPGGVLFGDLYYDDINDVGGDYTVQAGSIGPWYSVQFFRNGSLKMSLQAGNLGFSTGVTGGTGSWD